MRTAPLSFLAFLVFFAASNVYGQQDPQFSQYMLNPLFYNPAYSGVEGFTKFTAVYRSQWSGYNTSFVTDDGGAPNTFYAGLDMPLSKFNSGVGFFVVNDNLGPANNLQAQVSYAYHLAIKDSKLSFGLRAGIFSMAIDAGLYRPIDPNDPLIIAIEDNESQIRPDLAFGVWYQSVKFYAGVSVNHLLKSEFDFGAADLRNALEENLTFTAGYNWEINYNLVLTPSVIVKTDLKEYSFDLSVLGTYDDKFWGGLSFRQGDAVILLAGINLLKDKSLSLGYSFDYVIKGVDAKNPTSNELLISFTLPGFGTKQKKVVRTPRFRH